jgi:hypothetical protein
MLSLPLGRSQGNRESKFVLPFSRVPFRVSTLYSPTCPLVSFPEALSILGNPGGYQESFFLYSQVKIEEPVSMEMDNHLSDKDESCYDNAEAAFSDDEEDLNSKGKDNTGSV